MARLLCLGTIYWISNETGPLWSNKYIKYMEFGDLGKEWREAAINTWNDLLDNGILMSAAQISRKYRARCFSYMADRCSRLIPRGWFVFLTNHNMSVSMQKVYVCKGANISDGMIQLKRFMKYWVQIWPMCHLVLPSGRRLILSRRIWRLLVIGEGGFLFLSRWLAR